MARRRNGGVLFLLVLAILAVAGAFMFVKHFMQSETPKVEQPSVETPICACEDCKKLTVICFDVQFAENSCTVDLLKGEIKASEQADKIFVNINGVGTQYIEFTAHTITTTNGEYVIHELQETKSLCSTGFASATELDVDIYVEYGGCSHKVATQKVKVSSAWTKNY